MVYAQLTLNETIVDLSNKSNIEEYVMEIPENNDEINFSIETDDVRFWGSIILPVVIGIGTIGTYYALSHRDKNERKRNKVWELYNKFFSEQFIPVRNNVWFLVKNYFDKDRTPDEKEEAKKIINGFLEKKSKLISQNEKQTGTFVDLINSVNYNETSINQDTFNKQLNHIGLILYFWVELDLGLRDGHYDHKSAFTVFEAWFWWWKDFFLAFRIDYLEKFNEANMGKEKKDQIPEPLWVKSIENLQIFFENKGKYPKKRFRFF